MNLKNILLQFMNIQNEKKIREYLCIQINILLKIHEYSKRRLKIYENSKRRLNFREYSNEYVY